MSWVGPRPIVHSEITRYGHHFSHYCQVRPGITGLWQVSGRSDLPWEESVRLDLHYVENWSLALDAMIIWKTVFEPIGADKLDARALARHHADLMLRALRAS